MAYVAFIPSVPDPSTENGTNAFDSARENLLALRDALAVGTMPGWSVAMSGGTADQPTQALYSKSTERVKGAITWGTTGGAAGNVQSVVWSYSSNSGSTYDTIGTLTITYDASGYVTGAAWS